jgi:hypothetical protein
MTFLCGRTFSIQLDMIALLLENTLYGWPVAFFSSRNAFFMAIGEA